MERGPVWGLVGETWACDSSRREVAPRRLLESGFLPLGRDLTKYGGVKGRLRGLATGAQSPRRSPTNRASAKCRARR
jgi:hypothetical protein